MTIFKTSTLMMMSVVAAAGCLDASEPVDPGDEALPAPLVEADHAGAKVQIFQVAPGDLLVVATGELPEALEGKTPVQIYEAVAGAPAPAMLVERQAAIAAAQKPSSHVGSIGAGRPPTQAGDAQLTAADFQAANCTPGVVDFDFCFTNITGAFSRQFLNIKWIHSHLNAYRGTVSHTMKYRGFLGSWHDINFENTTGTSFVSTFSETDNGDYEVDISNAASDGYHLALHGDF